MLSGWAVGVRPEGASAVMTPVSCGSSSKSKGRAVVGDSGFDPAVACAGGPYSFSFTESIYGGITKLTILSGSLIVADIVGFL